MKAVFGIVALVIVLACVGVIAKRQLQAAGVGGGAAAAIGASAVGADGATVAQQARDLQEQARADTARALEQGAERNRRADP